MATVIDAILRLKDSFTPTLNRISHEMAEHEKLNKRIAKSITKTGDTFVGLGSKVAMISAPLAGAAAAGLKLHTDFENGMAKVSTLVDTSVVDMEKLTKGVRQVSDATGESVADLSEAMYQEISAGVDAGNATNFLESATKAAKAGFTDSATAIDALTNILNAYGMSADNVTKISDQMLMTQNLGKTTFGEMAQSMGQVTPIASSLNVSTEELFASMAALTKNSVHTSEAVTGLKAAYSNILKPTKEAGDMAEQIGMDFSAAHLKSVGWAKFLDEVKEKTGGNTDKMAQLFGSVEALNAVTVLAGKGSKDFAKSLDAMKNSSGTTNEAYEKLLTPSQRLAIAMNQLKNASMDLGVALAPLLKTTSKMIKAFADWFNSLSETQKQLLTFSGVALVGFGILLTAFGKIIIFGGEVFKTVTGIGAAIGEAGGLGKAITKELPLLEGFSTKIHVMKTQVINALESMGQFIARAVTGIFSNFAALGGAIRHPSQAFQTLKTTAGKAFDSVVAKAGAFKGAIGNAMGAVKNALGSALKLISNFSLSSLVTKVGNAYKAIKAFNFIGMFQKGFTAIRALMSTNPIGLALLAITVAIAFVIAHWKTFETAFTVVFNKLKSVVGSTVDGIKQRFQSLVSHFTAIGAKISAAWAKITGDSSKSGAILTTIINTLASGFTAAGIIISNVIGTAFNIVASVLDGFLTVAGGVIDFVTGVFTGDWEQAWNGIKEVFTGIIDGIKGVFDSFCDGIKNTLDSLIGKAGEAKSAAASAESGGGGDGNWTGTNWFSGGVTWLHEQGPELVQLPTGSKVIPHSESLKEEYQRGLKDGGKKTHDSIQTDESAALELKAPDTNIQGGFSPETGNTSNTNSVTINIPKLADSIIVREKGDIDSIANAIAFKLKTYAINSMQGAI